MVLLPLLHKPKHSTVQLSKQDLQNEGSADCSCAVYHYDAKLLPSKHLAMSIMSLRTSLAVIIIFFLTHRFLLTVAGLIYIYMYIYLYINSIYFYIHMYIFKNRQRYMYSWPPVVLSARSKYLHSQQQLEERATRNLSDSNMQTTLIYERKKSKTALKKT